MQICVMQLLIMHSIIASHARLPIFDLCQFLMLQGMDNDTKSNILQNKFSIKLIIFLICSSSHILVNKYVLSILKFQYPTIFISWQCGTCVFMLLTAYILGYIENIININSSLLRSWIPCAVMYTSLMYTGSISLSKLDIPIFLALQNSTYWFTEASVYRKTKKSPSVKISLSLILIAIGAFYLIYVDFHRSVLAYKWMSLFIISSGCYDVVTQNIDTKLSEVDKFYCNSLFSVVSLTIVSILTGEWRKSVEFPFLYYIRFHIGCICSGVLCFLSGVAFIELEKEYTRPFITSSKFFNSVFISILSFAIYEATMSVQIVVSILCLVIGALFYVYFKMKESGLTEEDYTKNTRIT